MGSKQARLNATKSVLVLSISVNSGFSNIYLAASWLGKYIATIHLDFKE